MGKTNDFLKEYKELESLAKSAYRLDNNESAIYRLAEDPKYRNIRNKLHYCREVRNLLSHNGQVGDSFAVEASSEMIELLRDTINVIKHPKHAKDIAVKANRIYTQTKDDFVKPAMREMLEKKYSHIPILRDGIVEGVFSENTLMSYVIDDGIIEIDESLRFKAISKYLSFENHVSEEFKFIPENKNLFEVLDLFSSALSRGTRIGMLFLTPTGKKREKLTGIITPWDVAGLWDV